MKTKIDREFEKRKRDRLAAAKRYRYPFGLLTVMDLVCGTRIEKRTSKEKS